MSGKNKKGKFIVLYGNNNVGKSTQAKLLVEKLKEKGENVRYFKYPIYPSKLVLGLKTCNFSCYW